MICKKCNGTGIIKYYHDAGDHFGSGTAPNSEWRTKPCDCNSNKIEYWDCDEDAEMLYCESMDEAIESYLDSHLNLEDIWSTDTLTVYGFVPIYPTFQILRGYVIEKVLEWLDEEYGPDDSYTEATDAMIEAEGIFIEAILKEYRSKRYKVAKKVEINVAEWVKENRPDWLEDLTA